MEFSFKIISSPGPEDLRIRDFIARNDNDFYPPIAARRDLTDFVQSVYDHNGKYVVCYAIDKIVGLTSVYLHHPSFITYYHYVAVDKEFRGQGIAGKLYDQVHGICREHGVQRAIVKTWSTNTYSQGMFHKHGFFHLDTIEDDRSPGIHTYFFAKSFDDTKFRRPIERIAILGSNDSYSLMQVAKTFATLPKSATYDPAPLPFTIVSLPFYSRMDNAAGVDKEAVIKQFRHVMKGLEGCGVSHLLIADGYNFPFLSTAGAETDIEIIDMAAITKKLVNERNKKCMLIAADVPAAMNYFDIDNVQIPGSNDYKRINTIIREIRAGFVSPAYYKQELSVIALINDCNCILLGSVELHNMFGTDKVYGGVEIFDPWMELAIIMQNNRIKRSREA